MIDNLKAEAQAEQVRQRQQGGGGGKGKPPPKMPTETELRLLKELQRRSTRHQGRSTPRPKKDDAQKRKLSPSAAARASCATCSTRLIKQASRAR